MTVRILFPYMARWNAVNWTRYHSLLTCIAERGHEVVILQPMPMQSKETNFIDIDLPVPPGIRLVDVRLPRWLWNRTWPLDKLVKKGSYALASLGTARRILRQSPVDAILLYNIPQYPYMFFRNTKRVFDYADDYVAMLRHELGRLAVPSVMKVAGALLDSMIRRADLVLSVSNVLAEGIGRSAEVLPNGVSTRKRDLARQCPLETTYRRPVVGFIGSFEYFIDFETILGAAELLPEATFLLVGAGRDWEAVLGEVGRRGLENVILPGGVPHQDVFRYIDRMDVCLNIFRKGAVADGACPIKLFEYLVMGKPVVTTRLKELEYIDDGFFFYGDDSAEVAASVREILSGTEEVRERTRKGEEVALSRYTWDRIADRFIELLRGGGTGR